ncbi:sugar kinase [Devosia sp. H5989]|nr:sugar kinase [Devosia sp. H5989]
MRKVVTIGEILVEIMATEPGDGFNTPIALVGPYPSGAPAIFIDQVARLGHPAGIIGCVGADDFGRLNLDRLRADGVDVSAVRVDAELPTGTAFVRYRSDGGRDFVFNIKHSACGAVRATPQSAALLAEAGHLHVMGSSLFSPALVEATLSALEEIKGRGGTISFDPNIRKEMLGLPGLEAALHAVLERTDLFLPSGQELFLFTSAREEASAVAEILTRARAVVIKRGADGSSYFDRDAAFHAAAFPAKEVDPTGAGDCFAGAFVVGWLNGLAPAEALRRANAAGALAVTRKGPMEGAASAAELDRFLASHG